MQNSESNKALYETAVSNNCIPCWYDGILGLAWHCGCADNLHGCDQQCSAISPSSAKQRRA